MNRDLVRRDQIISILLTMNKHRLQFTAVFCFTHAEDNLIKTKLYNN